MSRTLLPQSEKLYNNQRYPPEGAVRFREVKCILDDLQSGLIGVYQAIDAIRAIVPGIPVTGTTKGDIIVWDGLGWVLLAAGADREVVGADSTSPSGLAYYAPSAVVAQGLAVTDTDTIDLTLLISTLSAAARLQMSITSDVNGIKLVNDELAPGNSEYYGTDGAGVKGFFPLPASPGTDLAIANRTATTLDVTSSTGTDATVPQASITEAGLLIATDKVKLNNTSGTNSGDVTLAGENYLSIAAQVITANPVNLAGSNVTGDLPFTNIQQISTDRLLGRDTAGSGDIEEITLDSATLAFTGATGIKGVKETFQISAAFNWNPVDATTVYFSGSGSVAQSANVLGKRIIPRAGTLTGADIMWGATSVAGSNENISLYVRVNDTTDYLVATVGNTNVDKQFVNMAMNGGSGIAFNGTTDFYMMKCICPTWGTNPTAVQWQGLIYFILT